MWTPDLAKRWLDFTKSAGGRIAAAEWMNEPTLAGMGGAPKGYDADAYGRDFKLFRVFAKQAAPDMKILGPGSVGETTGDWSAAAGYGDTMTLKTRDILASSQPGHVDGFSYHHYGAASLRCASTGPRTQTSPEAALTEQWLARTDETLAFYRRVRDEFEPGKAFWNTETADAACGGNPWANTFLDTFRYLDQLGRLAKQEVAVVTHNTLVASDYGLAEAELLGGAALAPSHGNDRAGFGGAHSGRTPPLRPLPARHAWRRSGACYQQQPHAADVDHHAS
jgi:hypothetical protein